MRRSVESLLRAHFRNKLNELDKSWLAWGWHLKGKTWVIEVATRHGKPAAMQTMIKDMYNYTGQQPQFIRTLRNDSIDTKTVVLKGWTKKVKSRDFTIYQLVLGTVGNA